MRLAKRTGATKAKVALVRKLAVSLHRLWRDGRNDATAIPRALLERANLGRLRLQHWKVEAPNAIMGWTVFQVRDPDYEPPLMDFFQPVEAGAAVDVPI